MSEFQTSRLRPYHSSVEYPSVLIHTLPQAGYDIRLFALVQRSSLNVFDSDLNRKLEHLLAELRSYGSVA